MLGGVNEVDKGFEVGLDNKGEHSIIVGKIALFIFCNTLGLILSAL